MAIKIIATLVITRPGICNDPVMVLPGMIMLATSKKDGWLNRKLQCFHETDVCVSST